MKTTSLERNTYKKGILNNGWKYRHSGNTIIGFNDVTQESRTFKFPTKSAMMTEFKRLTGKTPGRPKYSEHELVDKTNRKHI